MSLGWNTESALLPSKSKDIKNVTGDSMMGLKAVIYKQELKMSKEGGTKRRRGACARRTFFLPPR